MDGAAFPPAVSWWAGDETTDDEIGNNHAYQFHSLQFENGVVGQAFSFDGQSSRLTLLDLPSLQLTRSLTIEGWIYIKSLNRAGMIFFRGDDRSALDPYHISVSPGNKLRFAISSLTATATVDVEVPVGTWMHLATVLDDATGRMDVYINGVLVGSTITKVRPFRTLNAGSNPGIGIGNSGAVGPTPHNFPFHGLIDELTVYAVALTETQIRQIVRAGSNGKYAVAKAPPIGVVQPPSTPAPSTPAPSTPTPNTPAPILVSPDIVSKPAAKIAFHSNRDGNDEIYTMLADGSEQRRLTHNIANDGGAMISPDGKRVAFTSNRDGNLEVYLMNADGSQQHRLTNHAATDIASSWSPGSDYLAFYSNRNGNYDIFIADTAGTMLRLLTEGSLADDIEPAFSPDGRRVVFSSRRDGNFEIYVMATAGGRAVRLTRSEVADREPAWSPDGRYIAWTRKESDGDENIFLMNSDGSGQKRLTAYLGRDVRPSFSADGKKIVFASGRDGNMEIYAMGVDGTHVTRLTSNLAGDLDPYAAPLSNLAR